MTWTSLVAAGLLVTLANLASADMSWPGAEHPPGDASRIMLPSAHVNCKDLTADARLIFTSSAAWRKERSDGHRRAGSRNIVFYQYADHSMQLPYAVRGRQDLLYDPFESLGFIYGTAKELSCGNVLPAEFPEWPWGATVPPGSGSAITALGKLNGRSLYLESDEGFVTDVYYCSTKLTAGELDVLGAKLKTLYHFGRLERTSYFLDYQQLRESYCAEERPSLVGVSGRKQNTETRIQPVLPDNEQPTLDVSFTGKPAAATKPLLPLQAPKLSEPPFMMPARPGALN